MTWQCYDSNITGPGSAMTVILQDLAVLADFDHLDFPGQAEGRAKDLVWKKQFYSTANCVHGNGEVVRLKKFAREWLEVTEDGEDNTADIVLFVLLVISGMKCTDPQDRRQRLDPKKSEKSDMKSATDAGNSVLADEPHIKKVKNSHAISEEDTAVVTDKAPGQCASTVLVVVALYITGLGVGTCHW